MRLQENIATLSAIVVGLVVLALSLYSLNTDYTSGKPAVNLIIDAFMVLFSATLIGGSLSLRKRITGYEVAATRAFNEVVYSRLRPVLDEVAYGIVEMNALRKRVEEMDRKLDRLEEYAVTQKLTPEYKMNFYFRAVIAMVFYVATFMFMLQYTLPFNHMLVVFLYMYWWLFITHEFKIYSKGEALVMLLAPVLLVPSLYLLLKVFFGIPVALGVVLASSALYAYYYYTIARNIAGGDGGSGIGDVLKRLRHRAP